MTETIKPPRRWCVVGGGMLGLTLAHRLTQAGEMVTVKEAESHLGGLASAWSAGGVVWDRHYHATLLSDRHLRGLLAELGLERELQWVRAGTAVHSGGRLYPLDDGMDFLRFSCLDMVDKLRLALTVYHVARQECGHGLEQVTAADWLKRLSGQRAFDLVWQPFLRAKLGEHYPKASAAALWSLIRRQYDGRRQGFKVEMAGHLAGGYSRVFDVFRAKLEGEGARIETGCPVREIRRCGDGLGVISAAGEELFDRVVVTAAAPMAADICRGLTPEEQQRLRGIPYQGMICLSALLAHPLGGPHLTYIADAAAPFSAITEIMIDRTGRTLIYLPKYLAPDDSFFQVPDQRVEEMFLTALWRIHPHLRRQDILCRRISRARHILPVAMVNFSKRMPPMVTSLPGLAIVNSSLIVTSAFNGNDIVGLADTAVRRLLATARPGPARVTA